MLVDMIINVLIKAVDIFLLKSKHKQKMLETLEKFMEQSRRSGVRNVKIKRRYDEQLQELRRKRASDIVKKDK
jgi:predicted peroxiredoxin